jgi:hypothetical protein
MKIDNLPIHKDIKATTYINITPLVFSVITLIIILWVYHVI